MSMVGAASIEPKAAVKPSFFATIKAQEWREFANWVIVWIVLANIGFASMWLIGAPSRFAEIVTTGVVGLIVRKAPVWLRYLAFVGALVYSLLGFIAGLFNLAIGSLLHSLKFFAEINPANSMEYIIGAALLLAICGVALWQIKRPQGFSDNRLLILAAALILALVATDVYMGKGMRGHYARAADEATPFSSATENSGFGVVRGDKKRNLMLIMVESMGAPAGNAEMDRLLFARYDNPAIADRFEMTSGLSTYFNSTTAAEIREMCGRWGDYYEVLDKADAGCLPARLAKEGYETRAYHSFTGDFFDRREWYPNIGFQRSSFAESLIERGTLECGGVFAGACDRDVPALLAKDLKASDKPQFIYWLTVNSHLPVPPGMNLNVDRCENLSADLAENYPMICRQFALWDQMDRAIIAEITKSDFPPTDILIVGDHMPPYYDRHHRSQFAPDKVPWMLLRWRDAAADEIANASASADQTRDDG